MTVKDAAQYLGVSRDFIMKLIDRGKLHASRNPLYEKGPWRIPTEEVEALKPPK